MTWERAVPDYDGARVCNGAGRVDEAVERASRSIAAFADWARWRNAGLAR